MEAMATIASLSSASSCSAIAMMALSLGSAKPNVLTLDVVAVVSWLKVAWGDDVVLFVFLVLNRNVTVLGRRDAVVLYCFFFLFF